LVVDIHVIETAVNLVLLRSRPLHYLRQQTSEKDKITKTNTDVRIPNDAICIYIKKKKTNAFNRFNHYANIT
jgi:hypothetical protein